MKRILAFIGIAGVVVVGAFVAIVSMQPSETTVERSQTMAASPATVYPLISDLQAFTSWDPWSGRDPNQTMTYSDPASGVGAWYTWEGNDDVGKGRMDIIDVVEGEKIVENLTFIEPYPSEATVTLSVAAEGDGSQVTWSMHMENGFMSKMMGLFMDMDAMIGPDFETGLANLGALAEEAEGAAAEAEAEAEAAADDDPDTDTGTD